MLIKVCPKSGERQSKNDFLLIFFYIQSKGAAQSSILMILRHPLFVFSECTGPLTLPVNLCIRRTGKEIMDVSEFMFHIGKTAALHEN